MVAQERARRRASAEKQENGRGAPVLEVRSLKTQFKTQDGVVKAVDDVSFYACQVRRSASSGSLAAARA